MKKYDAGLLLGYLVGILYYTFSIVGTIWVLHMLAQGFIFLYGL